MLLWVSKSASSVSVLAKLPLFLEFTPASTDPSRAVFCVNKELVEMKLPCLQKQEAQKHLLTDRLFSATYSLSLCLLRKNASEKGIC